jgi:hypothetical protein
LFGRNSTPNDIDRCDRLLLSLKTLLCHYYDYRRNRMQQHQASRAVSRGSRPLITNFGTACRIKGGFSYRISFDLVKEVFLTTCDYALISSGLSSAGRVLTGVGRGERVLQGRQSGLGRSRVQSGRAVVAEHASASPTRNLKHKKEMTGLIKSTDKRPAPSEPIKS